MSAKNSLTKGRSNRVLWLMFFVYFISASASSSAGQIFFIYGQPGWEQINKRPYETSVFRLGSNNGLEKVWSIGPDIQINDIKTFYGARKAIISECDIIYTHLIKKLCIIPFDSVAETYAIDLTRLGSVTGYRYFAMKDASDQLRIGYKERVDDPSSKLKFTFVDSNDSTLSVRSTLAGKGEVRLSGIRSEYSGGESDFSKVKVSFGNIITSIDTGIALASTTIPDSVIKIDTEDTWNLIANTPGYFALASIPRKHGITHRQLLIYNRVAGTWDLLNTEGSGTHLRQVNDRLVGIVGDTDPRTNYDKHMGYESILREEVVVVNPQQSHQFIVHLGKNCEVLWIEQDSVYYRLDDSLYRARIENDDFIDRQLLLTDPRVRYFHWAFKGSMNE
jgi:hypothetical protein